MSPASPPTVPVSVRMDLIGATHRLFPWFEIRKSDGSNVQIGRITVGATVSDQCSSLLLSFSEQYISQQVGARNASAHCSTVMSSTNWVMV